MAEPFGPSCFNNGQTITAAQVDHLPIIASYARRLGLVEIVNRLVPVEMEVEPGIVVLGMVLDTLSGRSPLYHLESAFEAYDRALLFGQEIPPNYFNDDQIVNAIFLKRPERIEALGLILLISLLIWRLMEQAMRADLEAHNKTVPGWDNKPTRRPTAYMLTWKFKGVMTLCIGQRRRLAQPLSSTQQAFLEALHVPYSCFTHPPGAG